jgi:hypothetical protein
MNPCDNCKRPATVKCCHNCKKDAAECNVWHDCGKDCPEWKKPTQTNADRIRAMTDEELADWLARTQLANVAEALEIARIPWEQEDGMKDEVKKECLEWLKQPVEDNQ